MNVGCKKITETIFGANFLYMALFMLLVVFSFTLTADYDLWWHLNLGKSISETGSFNVPDAFSSTFTGKPQFRGEWLNDLLFYAVYTSAGLPGLYVLKIILLGLTLVVLARLLLDNLDDVQGQQRLVVVVGTLVLVLFAIRFRMFIRPYLFSYFFVALFLMLINRSERMINHRLLLLLPLLEILWANLSKGAIYGPVIFGLLLLGDLARKRFDFRRLIIFFALSAAACINPETWHIYDLILKYGIQGDGIRVGEQMPLTVNMLWGYGWRYTLAYQILVVLSLLYFVFWKGWRNPFHILLFLLFFISSLMMVRMVDFFSLAAPLFAWQPIHALCSRLSVWFGDRTAPLHGALLAIVVVTIAMAPFSPTYALGVGVKQAHIPEGALLFMEREGIQGTLFNSYPFGGYIPWRSPGRKVFIDGRGGQMYTPEFMKEYYGIIHDLTGWNKAEKRYGFEVALLEYDMKSMGFHFPRHLVDNPAWALVYWDDHSAVYLKRIERFNAIISKNEYRIAKPSLYFFNYLKKYINAPNRLGILSDLDRDLALNPLNKEACFAKVYLAYYYFANKIAVLNELNKCRPLKPETSTEHATAAMLLIELGRLDEAREEVRACERIDPDDAGLKGLKKSLSVK